MWTKNQFESAAVPLVSMEKEWERTFWPAKSRTRDTGRSGNKKCCNPEHLVFGTQKENAIDTLNHGSRATKLDADKVRCIRASALSAQELAKKYGVHITTIQAVKAGTTWSHIK